MVFKSKLFFSSKKSGSSSPNSNNSPRSVGSNSPSGSDKKKPKSNSKEETRSPNTKKDGSSKGKEASFEVQSSSPGKSNLSSSGSEVKKPIVETPAPSNVKEESASVSPIMASSLGLNRIKTRSGPLPQETFFGFENDNAIPVLPCYKLSKLDTGKKEAGSSKLEVDHISSDIGLLRSSNPALLASGTAGQFKVSPSIPGPVGSSEVCTLENSYELENPKESESPRYQALLRMTSAPRKRFPGDIKSFSHELNSKGVRPFPLWKPRRSNNLEEILNLIRTKFDKAKEEVNSDLFAFSGDLLDIYDKNKESHPELLETIEDLLVLAKTCAKTTSGEFWLQCEGIVQELDDRRQELSPGVLKQLHTRMLFILTRCTRLLQFHKESWEQEEDALQLRQSRVLHSADKRVPTGEVRDGSGSSTANALKAPSTKKAYSQEQRGLNWNEGFVVRPAPLSSPYNEMSKDSESPANIDKMSSWKRLPSPASKGVQDAAVSKEQNDIKFEPPQVVKKLVAISDDMAVAKLPDVSSAKLSQEHMPKNRHNISWGYWGDQSCISEESSIICRICEEEVPTTHVEDHSRICALADKYDQKGVSVDERLVAVAVTLEKITENFIQKDNIAAVESPDGMKISYASLTEEFDVLSPKLSDWSRRGSEDMLDCFPEADSSVFMDDMRCLPSMSCRTRFGPKSDQGMTTSSAGSMTPRSPIPTPKPDPVELLLGGNGTFHDQDDFPQMSELADIARCAANPIPVDDQSIQLLLSCLEDLRVVIDRRKFDALIVETFGTRIEKLIQEKYLQLCELMDDEKGTMIDEDAPLEDDVVRSLRTSPVHLRDRISIDDFELKETISRGAFGHVVLARKNTTGDLFAIKVLRKADMIRKNAVESILAERDILINARNPFVVRFFYSFTCSENLYLVMEYLNGGDFYSMLRKLGCLDETNARVYIAEVVLALEYLHSEGVVHRDLKPDNLLIAHDGHVKLTDFGLSKVGLINSTDDLSGPVSSAVSLLVEEKPKLPTLGHKRSAVGTPDYLAPEILLGTGHGATADWWSVGIILYEFIVGIPPFNADHPQQIFDNILNRNIQWPLVPEDMSLEARDLIDRLLTEDPHQRLGARGAAEVKQHIFFKDINWNTLAQQKAAFVPDSENALDTSYFQSRYSWNYSDEQCFPPNENEDCSDGDSLSGSSGRLSNHHDEGVDKPRGPAEFETSVSENYTFDNFSFKNLSQLAYINYNLMSKGHKDEAQPSLHRR
ncbi:probable serine/threonine protein kinase IRE3 isoform X1 [Arabidopsis lyrata subsp. lyrata]|uniref:probable serine/threonine protein kinase IRE3 isoform X1 n=1 Tax=Arabidopsis lyrata subsp. lyrata TaxID=81972 RepID=UPI000A29E7A4|nr:probable serine/threonine protein kinase IRE3 isoform X1 [Arabidopsis lyrata subsp. lyrata]XP_020866278.1 probable serine/threonine protein kinase IRE3 isoform X1 [Arabidopsis lyrata subsp. lyrata]XP_020866280.1 probable serine/threonine protein kinase IRE3 isoform X1 [Arabidopsis lyrata subsp. lyrata]|eukprot:XP_020866277.1 probable serine/threonine protein kinase IRE3 isoform X1 [Arabidopsis lyrata subsp. lyrata]